MYRFVIIYLFYSQNVVRKNFSKNPFSILYHVVDKSRVTVTRTLPFFRGKTRENRLRSQVEPVSQVFVLATGRIYNIHGVIRREHVAVLGRRPRDDPTSSIKRLITRP